MNLNKLMKQAQKMQEQMAKTQAELEGKTVEVSAAGGKVKVTANGAGDVLAIKIDKEVVDPNDVEFLEEMVLSAVQQAVEQGKALAQSEMSKLTGGLSIPDCNNDETYAEWRTRPVLSRHSSFTPFVIQRIFSRRNRAATFREFELSHRFADSSRPMLRTIWARPRQSHLMCGRTGFSRRDP